MLQISFCVKDYKQEYVHNNRPEWSKEQILNKGSLEKSSLLLTYKKQQQQEKLSASTLLVNSLQFLVHTFFPSWLGL